MSAEKKNIVSENVIDEFVSVEAQLGFGQTLNSPAYVKYWQIVNFLLQLSRLSKVVHAKSFFF